MKPRFFIISFFFFALAGFFSVECKCQNLTFVAFGDCHLQDSYTTGEKVLSKIIESIEKDASKFDFAVCLGDIVDYPSSTITSKYTSSLKKYLNITGKLKLPVYSIPGNHDIEGGEEFKKIFQQYIGNLFFTVKKGDFLLVFISSENISEPQINWIRTTITGENSPKIIFMHKPLFPVFPGRNYSLSVDVAAQLRKIFEENNVIAVISGHEHFFYVNRYGRITQVISGGAGANLKPAPEGGKSAYHYCIITVNRHGDVTVKPVVIEIK